MAEAAEKLNNENDCNDFAAVVQKWGQLYKLSEVKELSGLCTRFQIMMIDTPADDWLK